MAEEHGLQVLLDSHTAPVAGAVELLAGEAAAAERELRPACEGLERIGELGFLSSVAPLLVDALFAQGRDEEALSLTERWTPGAPHGARGRRRAGRLAARAGEAPGAREGTSKRPSASAREATAIVSGTDFLDLHAQALADLGEVLRLAGRPEESAAAVREAIRLYERKGNVSALALLAGTTASAPQ